MTSIGCETEKGSPLLESGLISSSVTSQLLKSLVSMAQKQSGKWKHSIELESAPQCQEWATRIFVEILFRWSSETQSVSDLLLPAVRLIVLHPGLKKSSICSVFLHVRSGSALAEAEKRLNLFSFTVCRPPEEAGGYPQGRGQAGLDWS